MSKDALSRPSAPRRRPELGEFLKARRARVRPEEVGLEPGSRRRTPGLRREEVALLAGVGVTWYTWLEQGRPINASYHVLDAVAATLRLDGTERAHLYQLADATPVRTSAEPVQIPQAITELLTSLEPLPAALINCRFDSLASNSAHRDFFHQWHSLPCVHRNTIWCALTEPNARELLIDYDTEVPYLVARMRAAYGHHLGDPDWLENIDRLSRVSEEFAELWKRHDVAEPEFRVTRFRHPVVGETRFTRTELEIAPMPDHHRVIVYTPVDEETRAKLPETRLTLS